MSDVPKAHDGIVTLISPYPWEQTLDRLRRAIAAKGLTLFLELDQQDAARSAGLTMPRGRLLLFGNPKAGTAAMLAKPEVGLDLPLKAWLWESAEGRVSLSYNDPAYIAGRHALPDAVAAPLAGVAPLLAGVVAGDPHDGA